MLCTNKTFFKNNYIGVQNQEIFIPNYKLQGSLFRGLCFFELYVSYLLK